jgi:hypothetical protein
LGWIGPAAVLWFYWPEAHGFFVNPVAIFLMVTSTACDIIYPFILARIRASERVLADGRVVAGYSASGLTDKKEE